MGEVRKPTLVAPAGDWAGLRSALDSGCDSVYFGVKGFNMRFGAGNFDVLEIKKVMAEARNAGCKGFLALNVIVYDNETGKVEKILKEAKAAGVDAVILWDTAVMVIAKKLGMRVHLSTQASVSNFEAVKFYASLGVKRIVLARECGIVEIKDICAKIDQANIDCEIETFIHGAMCVSVSGRCFLSQHTFGRSANRGDCLQPCRRKFKIQDTEDGIEYLLGEDHVLSPKDLCSINMIDDLINAGIHAFKIEGRMRSPEYVKVVTSSYRAAIDAFFEDRLDRELKEELYARMKQVYNRGFSDGFFPGEPEEWESGTLESEYERHYLGEVLKFYKKIGVAEVMLRAGGVKVGQELLITGKSTPATFVKVDELQIEHEPVKMAEKGDKVAVKIPFTARPKDKVFVWVKKH